MTRITQMKSVCVRFIRLNPRNPRFLFSRHKVGSRQRLDPRSRCPASLGALALLGTSRRKVGSRQRYECFPKRNQRREIALAANAFDFSSLAS